VVIIMISLANALMRLPMRPVSIQYIRIFFVRHDAAAGGELIGKTDESKVLIQV
jgi:hypothetical protein